MSQPAKAACQPQPDRRDWLEAFLEPWAASLADRLRAHPRAAAAVLGPSGSGREYLCILTGARMCDEGQFREVDLEHAQDRSRRGTVNLVKRAARGVADGEGAGLPLVFLKGAQSEGPSGLVETLLALGDLRCLEGMRILVPVDTSDLEEIPEDLVERAFNLRLHVPSPGPAEVETLLRERLRAEGIEGDPGPEGARRSMAATGGRPRALIRYVESYLLARLVAQRTDVGVAALDAWWWRGVQEEGKREDLHRLVCAVGAGPFFKSTPVEMPGRNGNQTPRPVEPDPEKRRIAIEGTMDGDSKAEPESSPEERRAEILEALSDPNPGVRKAAVYALVELGDPAAAESLVPLLEGGGSEDRRAAAYAIGQLAPPFGGDVLMAALEDPQPEVRQTAASALAAIGGPEAIPPLLRQLGDSTPAVRMSAESALGRLADSEGHLPFAEALSSADSRVRAGASRVSGALGLEGVREPLRERMADECARVRRYAATSLGELEDHGAVPVLAAALMDPDPAVREASATALTRATGEELGVALPRLLAEGDACLRETAGRALKSLHPRDALEPLVSLLDHSEMEVRQEAAAVLGCLGDRRAIKPLLRCHDKDWPEVGRVVSASLVRLGVDGARNGRSNGTAKTGEEPATARG